MSAPPTTYPHWGAGMARCLAEAAHTGQVDKAGSPYYLHPQRVARRVSEHSSFAGLPELARRDALIAAWLHDVVEDTTLTLSILEALGCPARALHAIDLLTRRRGQSSAEYYAKVRTDPTALLVKSCDIADNTDPARLARLDEPTRVRLDAKYAKARVALGISAAV